MKNISLEKLLLCCCCLLHDFVNSEMSRTCKSIETESIFMLAGELGGLGDESWGAEFLLGLLKMF